MEILNKPNFITLIVHNLEEFKIISELIEDKIEESIIRKNKIIIFPKQNNIKQRILFLKEIDKVFYKNILNDIKIEDFISKNIMIYLEENNKLLSSYEFKIIIDRDYKNIEIKSNNLLDKKCKVFFKIIFKNCTLTFLNNSVSIEYDKGYLDEVKVMIKKLENKKILFGQLSVFTLNIKNEKNMKAISLFLENEYKILHLTSSDDYDSFKKKYKVLSRKYHPDLNKFNNELLDKIYQNRFEKIQRAYKELKYFYKQNLVA